jgi:hypothetical protein
MRPSQIFPATPNFGIVPPNRISGDEGIFGGETMPRVSAGRAGAKEPPLIIHHLGLQNFTLKIRRRFPRRHVRQSAQQGLTRSKLGLAPSVFSGKIAVKLAERASQQEALTQSRRKKIKTEERRAVDLSGALLLI